ncbi:MAG: Type II secretion pathway-like protein [Idiomarina sp.]|nr:Type II secretion pathway-like protein [Idiomarina sp.]
MQLLQTSLSAVENAYQKAQAVEVLMAYVSDAQKAWSQGSDPNLSATTGQFDLTAELTSVDPSNAITEVTVSWGNEQELKQKFWLSR